MFTAADWTVVGIYLVLLVGIGVLASRGQKTKRDYFLGARRLPWYMVGLSIVAAETSALTFIGVPAMALGVLKRGPGGGFFTEGGNLFFIQITIGYVIARVIVSFLMVPHYFRGDVFTPYQVLTRAFGQQPRYLAACFSLVSACLGAGMRIYVTAIPVMVVIRTVYPWWGITESIILFTAVAFIYTAVGGITAIVWTDLIQFFLFFGGGLFSVFYIPTLINGAMVQEAVNAGHLSPQIAQTIAGESGWGVVDVISRDHLKWWNWGLVSRSQLLEERAQQQSGQARQAVMTTARSIEALADRASEEAAGASGPAAQEIVQRAGTLRALSESISPEAPRVAAMASAEIYAAGEEGHPPRVGFWAWIWANIARIIGGDFNIWMGLIGATIGVMVSHGVDQLNVQRVLACKNEAHGRNALIMSAIIVLPQFLIFLLVGAALYAFYRLNNFDFGAINPWDPNDLTMTPKADYVFPIFIVTHMPPVIRGILVAGILAAAMSSVAAALGAISSVSIMDIYRPLRGRTGEQKGELMLSRLSTVAAAVVLIAVAYFAKEAPLIFNLVFVLAGLTAGAMLGSVLFGIWSKSGYAGPVMAGMIVSFFTMLAIVILMRTTRLYINWPWLAPIGTAVCLAVAYAASYKVPRPTDRGIDRATETEI
jgi:Na+/proline symporter